MVRGARDAVQGSNIRVRNADAPSFADVSTSRPYDMYRDDEFNRDEYFYDGLGYRDELPPPGKPGALLLSSTSHPYGFALTRWTCWQDARKL